MTDEVVAKSIHLTAHTSDSQHLSLNFTQWPPAEAAQPPTVRHCQMAVTSWFPPLVNCRSLKGMSMSVSVRGEQVQARWGEILSFTEISLTL